jgi:hypothetical protein
MEEEDEEEGDDDEDFDEDAEEAAFMGEAPLSRRDRLARKKQEATASRRDRFDDIGDIGEYDALAGKEQARRGRREARETADMERALLAALGRGGDGGTGAGAEGTSRAAQQAVDAFAKAAKAGKGGRAGVERETDDLLAPLMNRKSLAAAAAAAGSKRKGVAYDDEDDDEEDGACGWASAASLRSAMARAFWMSSAAIHSSSQSMASKSGSSPGADGKGRSSVPACSSRNSSSVLPPGSASCSLSPKPSNSMLTSMSSCDHARWMMLTSDSISRDLPRMRSSSLRASASCRLYRSISMLSVRFCILRCCVELVSASLLHARQVGEGRSEKEKGKVGAKHPCIVHAWTSAAPWSARTISSGPADRARLQGPRQRSIQRERTPNNRQAGTNRKGRLDCDLDARHAA